MITLKKVSDEACQTIYEIQTVAFRPLLEKYRDYDSNPGAEPVEFLLQRFREPIADFYLILQERQPVGFVLIRSFGRVRELNRIAVLPAYQHRGVASAAVRLAEACYPETTRWVLETVLQEPALCHLYETLGYRQTGQTEPVQPGMDIVQYAKEGRCAGS